MLYTHSLLHQPNLNASLSTPREVEGQQNKWRVSNHTAENVQVTQHDDDDDDDETKTDKRRARTRDKDDAGTRSRRQSGETRTVP